MSSPGLPPVQPPAQPPHRPEQAPPLRNRRFRHWLSRIDGLFRAVARSALQLGERLPPGVRSVVGLSLMVGGVLGFLPVLGFWMFPAGVAMLSLDVPPLRRRLDRWLKDA